MPKSCEDGVIYWNKKNTWLWDAQKKQRHVHPEVPDCQAPSWAWHEFRSRFNAIHQLVWLAHPDDYRLIPIPHLPVMEEEWHEAAYWHLVENEEGLEEAPHVMFHKTAAAPSGGHEGYAWVIDRSRVESFQDFFSLIGWSIRRIEFPEIALWRHLKNTVRTDGLLLALQEDHLIFLFFHQGTLMFCRSLKENSLESSFLTYEVDRTLKYIQMQMRMSKISKIWTLGDIPSFSITNTSIEPLEKPWVKIENVLLEASIFDERHYEMA